MKTEEKEPTIYDLALHETIIIKFGPSEAFITRVAGGWLYNIYRLDRNSMVSTFVPFNNEFQLLKNNKNED